MSARLRIAQVGPVARALPPPGAGSVELVTWLLTEGLVARGHDVTLFATADTRTSATLHALFPHGYCHDPAMWPWEMHELINLAAAVERAERFDLIHVQAEYYPMSLAFTRLSPTPILQTLHYLPKPAEVTLWQRYPEAPFTAISGEQARLLAGLNVLGTVPHGIDTRAFTFRERPDDYLLFLGRFTEAKGVIQAIDIARRAGLRLRLAAQENDYYRAHVAPLVDGGAVEYVGEVGAERKVALLGGARALLYPLQAGEAFGLVLAEAMACGTPVAALDRGAVREVVDEGVTGGVFASEEAMITGLSRVMALDRRRVRDRAVERFDYLAMADGYIALYERLLAAPPRARSRTA